MSDLADDVEYGRVGGHPLLARLYQPAGPGPFPGIVEVHGGAWNGLSYLSDEGLNQALAERGIFVASLEFRQPPAARFPASVHDVTTGIEWLAEHRERLGLTAPIGALGNSSGGHQVMLTGLVPGDARFGARATPTRLDYAVLCWPVIDPVARYRWAAGPGGRPELVAKHLDYWGDEQTMASGSPQHLLDSGQVRHRPDVLVVQGGADENLPPEMLTRFAESYRESGGTIEVEIVPGKTHNFVLRDLDDPDSQRAIDLIATFILARGR